MPVIPETSHRSYIASAPFHSALFTYTQPVRNGYGAITTPGSLTPIAGGNASTCPARRVLRETGKKLYPGVHSGVLTYMVSVYDNVNMWNGYIDPNSPFFAVFSTDKPNFLSDGVDAATGAPADAGVPVITNGLVSAALSVSAGTTVTAGTFVYAGSGIGYATGSGGSFTQLTSKSTPVTLNKPTGIIITSNAELTAGTSVSFTLNNTFIDANDIVILNWNYGAYNLKAFVENDNTCSILIHNFSGTHYSEAITIRVAVIKAASA